MIIYLHGFDATSPAIMKKCCSCSLSMMMCVSCTTARFTLARHEPSAQGSEEAARHEHRSQPLICGVGLGGYWATDRVSVRHQAGGLQPNLHPEEHAGKIDRPEEYEDIGTKCVTEFRNKNSGNCLCILSVQDEIPR